MNTRSGSRRSGLAAAVGAVLAAACLACGCAPSTTPAAALDASAGGSVAVDYEGLLAGRYDDLFPDDRVLTVRVLMKDDDLAEMRANVRGKEYYRADIWIDDELMQDVAVRTKGSSSLMSAAQAGNFRPGLKVDFNFFNSARSYNGIKKLVYNNGFSDPTLMKEFLGYELMAEMGVATPRACFADLWVNDTHLGLYTQVEVVDATFASEHFSDGNGNLYKPELTAGRLDWTQADVEAQAAQAEAAGAAQEGEAGTASTTSTSEAFNVGGGDLDEIIERAGDDAGWIPGSLGSTTTITVTGDGRMPGRPWEGFSFMGNSSDYLVSAGLKTNEDRADHSHLYRLLDVLNTDPAGVSEADLDDVLDVDGALRFLAVSVALVHLDNYIGMGHNYYLYEVGGRFSIIPWDLNMSFGGFDSGLSEEKLLAFYIDEPTSGPLAQYPLVQQLMDEPGLVETYHSYLEQLIEGPFSVEHMAARIAEIAALIRPYVERDENLLFSVEAFERGLSENTESGGGMLAQMGGKFIGLTKFVAGRASSIAAQLSGEQAASAGDGSGNGGNVGMGLGGGPGGFPGGNFPGGNRPAPQGGAQQGPPAGVRPPTSTTTTTAPPLEGA